LGNASKKGKPPARRRNERQSPHLAQEKKNSTRGKVRKVKKEITSGKSNLDVPFRRRRVTETWEKHVKRKKSCKIEQRGKDP